MLPHTGLRSVEEMFLHPLANIVLPRICQVSHLCTQKPQTCARTAAFPAASDTQRPASLGVATHSRSLLHHAVHALVTHPNCRHSTARQPAPRPGSQRAAVHCPAPFPILPGACFYANRRVRTDAAVGDCMITARERTDGGEPERLCQKGHGPITSPLPRVNVPVAPGTEEMRRGHNTTLPVCAKNKMAAVGCSPHRNEMRQTETKCVSRQAQHGAVSLVPAHAARLLAARHPPPSLVSESHMSAHTGAQPPFASSQRVSQVS